LIVNPDPAQSCAPGRPVGSLRTSASANRVGRAQLMAASLDKANEVLAGRLLVPLPQLAGRISATLDPSCTLRAARALLHELTRADELSVLGLLTEQGAPYLALYRHEDRDEINRQLSYMRAELARGTPLVVDDLPAPGRALAEQGWADVVLAHAEFRCWGRRRDGSLVPWDAQ
jgi:hypothetical protein